MAIPEAQLETWSHQGAVPTSKDTYATIRRALEDPKARYANKQFEIFLQGSYGNDTNIYAESDVDIVTCCSDTYYRDVSELPPVQSAAQQSSWSPATYEYADFKSAVFDALSAAFGKSVSLGNNSIKIAASGSRRSADVIPAFEFRRYYRYISEYDCDFHKGITFFRRDGAQIDNFPKHHSENLTRTHQSSANRLKPTIRIFKNIRSVLVERGALQAGDAPSYFIEGLIYNAPTDVFKHSKFDTVLGILQWLCQTTDRTNFLCANDRYFLLRDSSPLCWPAANCDKFIGAAIDLWNNWG